ncbi:MAG: TatD family hydrolase [Candidatus Kapabacteria bacterium]|nr:TatD family hydrolase [Candidatus Kapabacteria bacterium]
MIYVDALAQRRSASQNVTSLVNIRITASMEVFETDGICTVGLHPEDVNQDWRDALDIVEELTSEELVLGIGESGLDRSCNASWLHQIDAFEYSADLAERVSKPLTVHCLKAHDELLRVHKFIDPLQPWLVHGFVKGADLARQFLDVGMTLSFGSAVLKESSSLVEAIRICPPDKFLLETDSTVIPIEDIYAAVASIRGVPLEEMCETLHQTFEKIFVRSQSL